MIFLKNLILLLRRKQLLNHYKELCVSSKLFEHVPSNVGSGGSVQWMTRHINDPYVKRSRYKNYRARSAFKLIEIDDQYKLLKPGFCVVDCGAAPGSWTQVAVERVNATGKDAKKPKGIVVGLDLNPIAQIPGATLFDRCDFTTPESREKILSFLSGKSLDVVLSDMCPNISGHTQVDSDRISHLAFSALQFAVKTLNPGGHILVKGFTEMKDELFFTSIKKFFTTAKRVKPDASRGDSSELFYLGHGFKGIKKNVTDT